MGRALIVAGLMAIALGCAEPASPPASPVQSAGLVLPAITRVPLRPGLPPALRARLAFHSDREGRHRLFVVELPAGVVRRLTDGRDYHDEEPVWSPDATRLAFTTTRFDRSTFDIAILDLRTGDVRRVTNAAPFERHPAWSADGRGLYFTSDRDGLESVYEVHPDGEGVPIRLSSAETRARMVTTDRTGTALAHIQGSRAGLQVVLVREGRRQPISPSAVDASEPRFSPDGDRLAYAALSDEGAEVHLVRLPTGAVDRLAVEGLVSIREPAWSPDEQFLAVAGTAERGPNADWDLYVIGLEPPRVAYRVTSGLRSDRSPHWSPE